MKPIKILMLLAAILAAFFAGMRFQSYIYEDQCLDYGGGRNPGNHPICVIDTETLNARQQP